MQQEFGWGRGLSPFFTPEDFLPTYPTLKENRKTDVLVIGGGLSGLLCAYFLCSAGRNVTVVTANTVGDGASRFGTGMLCGDGGPELGRLMEVLGREPAVSWYRSAACATAQLEQIVANTGSKCDFVRREGVYYTANAKDCEILRREYLLRHHMGLPCRWIKGEECEERFSFPCAGGILMEDCGEFNQGRLCRDLADWVSLHGGEIFEGCRVDSMEALPEGGYRCQCGEYSLTSRSVVDTRGGEVLEKRPRLGRRMTVFSVATVPLSEFHGLPEGILLKSRDEFSFLRTTSDRRIVFSGEASFVLPPRGKMSFLDVDALCGAKYRNLEEDLGEMFFGIPELRREFSFCQSLVMPPKGLPYVGRDARWSDVYYLYAFGEGGLVGAILGASWIGRTVCDGKLRSPQFLTLP